jgi:fructokinase
LKSAYVFLDVNLRLNFYSREILSESLARATICKLNENEVQVISPLLFGNEYNGEDFHHRIAEQYGIMITCITKGAGGCSICVENSRYDIPGLSVLVADTVGSGDAFSAAFLYTLCKTGDPVQAAEYGNILGAFVASRQGAVPEYPDVIKKQLGLK